MNSIFQPVDLCLLSPAVIAYTAARSVLVSRLTSTCQPLDQHLISHAMIIYSAAVSDAQPFDLLLSGALSLPALLVIQRLVNHLTSVSQPLDHRPLSRLKSAYTAER